MDVFCQDDIANVLLAAENASSSTTAALLDVAGSPARLRAFREGYRAALVVVALAFGLKDTGIGALPAPVEAEAVWVRSPEREVVAVSTISGPGRKAQRRRPRDPHWLR